MPLAAFQNESRLATERESEFRVSQSVRVSVRVSDSVCERERDYCRQHIQDVPLTEAEFGARTGKKSGIEFNSANN